MKWKTFFRAFFFCLLALFLPSLGFSEKTYLITETEMNAIETQLTLSDQALEKSNESLGKAETRIETQGKQITALEISLQEYANAEAKAIQSRDMWRTIALAEGGVIIIGTVVIVTVKLLGGK